MRMSKNLVASRRAGRVAASTAILRKAQTPNRVPGCRRRGRPTSNVLNLIDIRTHDTLIGAESRRVGRLGQLSSEHVGADEAKGSTPCR